MPMLRHRSLVAVVNDEVAFVRVLDALLRDEGYTTLLLQVGPIAYESIKQQHPDLVILDISVNQPEQSWQVVDLLTLDPATQTIPIIICTVADQIYQERASKLASTGCSIIEKPFALDELVAQIRAQQGADQR